MAELNTYLRGVGDPIKTAMLIGQAKGGSTVAEQHLVNTFGMEQNLSKEERINKFDTLLKDVTEKNPEAKAAHDKALESQKEMVNKVSNVDPFNIGQSIKDAKEYENKKFGTAVTAASNEKAELKAQLAKLEAAIKEKKQAVKKQKNPKREFKKQQRQNARALDKIGKDLQKKEKGADKTFEKQTEQIDKETEKLVKQAAKQTKQGISDVRKRLKQDIAEEKKKIKKAEKEVNKASKKFDKVKNKKGVSQKKIDERAQKLASKQTKLAHRKEVLSSLREQRKSFKENMPKDIEEAKNRVRENQQVKKDMAGQARDNTKQELRQSAKEEIQKIHKRDYSVDAKDKLQQESSLDKSAQKAPAPQASPSQSLSNKPPAPPVPPKPTVSAAQSVPPDPPPSPPKGPAAKEVAENKSQGRPGMTQEMKDKIKTIEQKLGIGQMKFEGNAHAGSSVSPSAGGAGKEKSQEASR